MGLPVRVQAIWWGAAGLALILVVWLIGSALLPFIIGAAIAYFLDPVADRLEALGLSRVLATVVITVAAILAFAVIVVVVVPFLVQQVTGLVQSAPGYVAQLQAFLAERFPELLDEGSVVRRGLTELQDNIRQAGLALVNVLLQGSLNVLNFMLVLVVAPVVAFYLLMDWDHLVARIDSWLPREHAPVIRRLAREIDQALAGFVRGQTTVCLLLGIFYAAGLTLVGLQFGAVVGFVAGLISFIPFVGSILGGAISIGIALFQFWDQPVWIGIVAAIFGTGQFIEGNILSPRLVGRSVGLHPVWLMLALSAFGALLGFAGLLIAVPVAAAIGVLGRFALEVYLDGRLYQGPAGLAPDLAADPAPAAPTAASASASAAATPPAPRRRGKAT
jgi:predicted PurR-regulated permease PerM